MMILDSGLLFLGHAVYTQTFPHNDEAKPTVRV